MIITSRADVCKCFFSSEDDSSIVEMEEVEALGESEISDKAVEKKTQPENGE